jgi:predicted nucleic acid-binding protein
MISFDTSILVYATASGSDAKALRARDVIARAMRSGWAILLLQTLAEFSNVAIRKAGIPISDVRRTIDAWRAVLPVQAADDGDLTADLHDGFILQSVRFINPFKRVNDRLVDEVLLTGTLRR